MADLATWLKLVKDEVDFMDPILAKFVNGNEVGKYRLGINSLHCDDAANNDEHPLYGDTFTCYASASIQSSSPTASHDPTHIGYRMAILPPMEAQGAHSSGQMKPRPLPPHLREPCIAKQLQKRVARQHEGTKAKPTDHDSNMPDWSKLGGPTNIISPTPEAQVDYQTASAELSRPPIDPEPASIEIAQVASTLLTPPATRASEPLALPESSRPTSATVMSKTVPIARSPLELHIDYRHRSTSHSNTSSKPQSDQAMSEPQPCAEHNSLLIKVTDWAKPQDEIKGDLAHSQKSVGVQPTPAARSSSSSSHNHKSTVSSGGSSLIARVLGVEKPSSKRKAHKGKQTKPSKAHPPANRWLKSSEIPKGPDPRKIKARDLKSRYSGWATHSEEGKGNNDWDPSAVFDWDNRPAFRDEKLSTTISDWTHCTERELRGYDTVIDLTEYRKVLLTPIHAREKQKEFPAELLRPIAPTYWIPTKIDGASPVLFWKKLLASNSPRPADEDDLRGAQPWWQQFPPYASAFEQDYQQPTIKAIDPDETNAQRTARRNDHGSNKAVKRLRAQELRKLSALHRHLPTAQATPECPAIVNTSSKPRVLDRKAAPGLLIRSANREDMPQICTIYNHYINFSVAVDEVEPITEQILTERWRKALLAGLPMLVACEEAHIIKDRRKAFRGEQITIPDKVIGFAFISDYPLTREVYRQTKRLQVFTHNEYYLQGIATCLVDKLLKILDKDYVEQTDLPADIDVDTYGPKPALVNSLLVQFLYDSADLTRYKWVSKWLRYMYGFGKPAKIPHVARKHDKLLNLAIFQKDLGVEQDPAIDGADEGW